MKSRFFSSVPFCHQVLAELAFESLTCNYMTDASCLSIPLSPRKQKWVLDTGPFIPIEDENLGVLEFFLNGSPNSNLGVASSERTFASWSQDAFSSFSVCFLLGTWVCKAPGALYWPLNARVRLPSSWLCLWRKQLWFRAIIQSQPWLCNLGSQFSLLRLLYLLW